ncbi:HD domain-containing protein [Vibrio aquaticus]|uniref:HD domain-containing protein n=1 Tax=Vibrio aquaticus TaxID=2496559 RepID=A0A3S0MLY8_9VIBR|nr:HD domain-containing phosphohydrolase [Vibrio aquaticus]RTZ18148.1 HD domain-containing protein [Vibrio aquaticus]
MNFHKDDVSVDMHRVLFEIAYALDAVGHDETYHGHRVAYIAYQCAVKLGWDEEKSRMAFSLGLIHDCGVSESKELNILLSAFVPKNTERHCMKGYELLLKCGPLKKFAVPVLYHHTPWEQLASIPYISPSDKSLASLVFLADRVDYLHRSQPVDGYGNVTSQTKRQIASELVDNAGAMFEPQQVQAMGELLQCDDFWFSMESRHIESLSDKFVETGSKMASTGLEDSISVAELFAQIVDAKSSFTYQHSYHVARLAEFLAQKLGYDSRSCRMLYLAGLIHDIGKLKTPSKILHKADALTEDEYRCIKRHATDSRHALENMFHQSSIIDWAANHHERLDGSGYPLGLTKEQLDGPSRLVAVTDVFQALTQSRPYRAGLSLEESMSILKSLVDEEKLDRTIFNCVDTYRDQCYRISTGCEEQLEPA